MIMIGVRTHLIIESFPWWFTDDSNADLRMKENNTTTIVDLWCSIQFIVKADKELSHWWEMTTTL